LARGAPLSGDLVFVGDQPLSVPETAFAQATMVFESLDPARSTVSARIDSSTLRFRFPALPPAQVALTVRALPGYVTSVEADQRLLSPPVIDGRAPPQRLLVNFTDRPPRLRGVIHGLRAADLKDVLVLVFPEDDAFWNIPRRFTDRYQALYSSPDGSFESAPLQLGRYFVIALTNDYLTTDWREADFLRRSVPLATRVTVTESGATVVLKPVRWPQ
jgi:hypothetical protein